MEEELSIVKSGFIAFIPVRGGSKGIPKKNVKLLNGKPLLYYVINSAINCSLIDKIVVATDASYIRTTVLEYFSGNSKIEIYIRSESSSTDEAPTEDVMLEYAKYDNFQNIILLQATSPLTSSLDIEMAIARYTMSEAGSLLSVVRQKRFIWEESTSFFTSPVNYDYLNRPRRQDFDGYLVENGAIYITSRSNLLKHRNRLTPPIAYYEMREESYVEIDEQHDWEYIEGLMKRSKIDSKSSIKENWREIKLVLTDVDGVLTDAGMYYTEDGNELKKFNTRDGKAFELLRDRGILTGIVTSENTQLVERRSHKIKADFLYQGCKDKLIPLKEIVRLTNIPLEKIAYIGDDINDLDVLKVIGLSACPNDAVKEVKEVVHIVLSSKGGEGAFREFVNYILSLHQVD